MTDLAAIVSSLVILASPPAAPVAATPEVPAAVADEAWRESWTDFAFEVASAIPTEIHGRDRAKAQHAVVSALVAQGKLLRASQLAPAIRGWRQGEALAEIALACAKAGKPDEARSLAKQALALVPSLLDWQRERVNVMVGRVYVWLGEQDEAKKLEQGVGESEMGKVAAARAGKFPAEQFDAQMAGLEGWIKTKNFDLVRNSVDVALEFYPACLTDAARRGRVETLVAAANDQLAFDLRVANLLRMAEIVRTAGETDAARSLVAKADAVVRPRRGRLRTLCCSAPVWRARRRAWASASRRSRISRLRWRSSMRRASRSSTSSARSPCARWPRRTLSWASATARVPSTCVPSKKVRGIRMRVRARRIFPRPRCRSPRAAPSRTTRSRRACALCARGSPSRGEPTVRNHERRALLSEQRGRT